MPSLDKTRSTSGQIPQVRGQVAHPSNEDELLTVRRYAEVVHTEARPTRQLPGFLSQFPCILIEPHFPEIACAAKKRLGLLP